MEKKQTVDADGTILFDSDIDSKDKTTVDGSAVTKDDKRRIRQQKKWMMARNFSTHNSKCQHNTGDVDESDGNWMMTG